MKAPLLQHIKTIHWSLLSNIKPAASSIAMLTVISTITRQSNTCINQWQELSDEFDIILVSRGVFITKGCCVRRRKWCCFRGNKYYWSRCWNCTYTPESFRGRYLLFTIRHCCQHSSLIRSENRHLLLRIRL